MQLVPIPQHDRTPELIRQLLDVWERSVTATHLFLSGNEIRQIKEYVPQALRGVAHLVVAQDGAGRPAAFMGVEDGTLEMLFITPEERGKGLGRRLLQYGIEHYAVQRLTVNEQNPQAKGFYEHMGFCVYKRTDRDEQGAPTRFCICALSAGAEPGFVLSLQRKYQRNSQQKPGVWPTPYPRFFMESSLGPFLIRKGQALTLPRQSCPAPWPAR